MGDTEGVIRRLGRRYDELVERGIASATFAIQALGSKRHVFGRGEPSFTMIVRDDAGLAALRTLDLMTVGEAYLRGFIDIEGDLSSTLSLRDLFSDRKPLVRAWHHVRPLLFGQIKSDKHCIHQHYDHSPDFFLSFLDRRYRCYSHGFFERDDEPLEDAIEHKLDFATRAAGIEPGQRVLDIGGGWGAFVEYGGRRGINVVSITISAESEKFMNELIARERLPCKVVREHLFEHRPDQPYDAIVNLGVTEHLPHYSKTLEVYDRLVRPGGKVYLDFSAARRRYDLSSFLLRHIYQGNGTLVCLHDYLAAVAQSPWSVTEVHNDRHNYYLTAKHWAQRLDENRADIEKRFGRWLHRVFQLYLWGCADGFRRDMIQAYHMVLQRA